MNKHRKNLLELAWIGPPLAIAGKPVILSHGRHALLSSWRNRLFDPSNQDQDATVAMGETVMVCAASADELKALRAMSQDERKAATIDFLLDHEDEISDVAEGIQLRMEAMAAAAVDTSTSGKEE